MKRRQFLKDVTLTASTLAWLARDVLGTEAIRESDATGGSTVGAALAMDWLARWEKNILGDARNRYCDREMGEEIGWRVSPFLNGFYFMWNHQIAGARFQRIDGGEPDPRWKDSPGMLWTALVPYDQTLRRIFLANHDPAGWGGLVATPWFLAYEALGTSTIP
jgi:hypothetical protein